MRSAYRRKILFAVSLAALAGCIPEKRVVWSPDGTRAAVIAADGLHLCSPDGALSKPLLAGARRVAWFPDNKRLLVLHTTKAKTWADVEKLITPAQRDSVAVSAKELREQVLAFNGPWDKFKPRFTQPLTGGEQAAALIYLRDKLGDGLAKHVGTTWKEFEQMELDVWNAQVFDVGADSIMPGKNLVVSIDELQSPSVAPSAKLAAFARPRGAGDNPAYELVVIATDAASNAPILVAAKNVSLNYDWSPDSRSLAYIYTASSNDEDRSAIQLGALATIDIADASGKLLVEPAKQDDRAGLLFQQFLTVRWLKDGRLLFSSYETSLPATTRDMPQQWTLFAIDPRMSASVLRVLPRDVAFQLQKELPWFDVSPDGRRVLLPGTAGRVALFDLATSESTEIVTDNDPDGDLRTLPVWRNNDEACVAVPPGSSMGTASRCEIILWKDPKQARMLSKNWPAEATENWLTPKPRRQVGG